jgi:hypothetical protein
MYYPSRELIRISDYQSDLKLCKLKRSAWITQIEKGDNSKPSKDAVKKVFSAPIMFWRKIMSRHWGIRCSHYPSCSKYSLLAIEKHGPIIGFVMTFDRLQHESNEARYSPVAVINGETRVLDPVENNDFWWYGK